MVQSNKITIDLWILLPLQCDQRREWANDHREHLSQDLLEMLILCIQTPVRVNKMSALPHTMCPKTKVVVLLFVSQRKESWS